MCTEPWLHGTTLGLLVVLGWSPAAWPGSHAGMRPSSPLQEGAPASPPLFREQGARELCEVFYFILKYVIIVALLASLIGSAVCQFSEPASDWCRQPWRKLLGAPCRESLPWLAFSVYMTNQLMQNQHKELLDLYSLEYKIWNFISLQKSRNAAVYFYPVQHLKYHQWCFV